MWFLPPRKTPLHLWNASIALRKMFSLLHEKSSYLISHAILPPLPLEIPYSFLYEAAEETENSFGCRFIQGGRLWKIKGLLWELNRYIDNRHYERQTLQRSSAFLKGIWFKTGKGIGVFRSESCIWTVSHPCRWNVCPTGQNKTIMIRASSYLREGLLQSCTE